MFTVSKDIKLKFYESFGKTEESVEKDVEIIREWLQTQHHLPEIMEDARIRNFLNMNKFSIERTKQKIDMYYTMRTIAPEAFLNPKEINFEKIFSQADFGFSPFLIDGKHRASFIVYRNTFDTLEQLISLFLIFYEIRLKEDFIIDDLLIVDWKNVSLSGMHIFSPSLLYKCLNIYKKIFSMRIYKLFYINAPSYVSNVISILKTLMEPKIFDRLQVHKDEEILKEIFPNDMLPSNFGGNGPSLVLSIDDLKTIIAPHQDRFDLLDTLKVDENLRTEKLNNDELLGYYGNFKKLDVD